MHNQRSKSYDNFTPLNSPSKTDYEMSKKIEDFNLGKETLNMHYLWLRNISDVITEYMNAYLQKDVDRQLDMLHLLETLASPKMNLTVVIQKIDWLDANIDKALVKDTDGTVIRWNPALLKKIKLELLFVFRTLLIALEERGILTFEPSSPHRAMGRFSGA
jgi:hypothetical protein